MPADMPVEDIIEELEGMGIHPKECRRLHEEKRRAHVLSLSDNQPANYTGCPRNPLNRSPPPPKDNFWEETARRKKEMLDAANEKSDLAQQAQKQIPTQAQETSSSRKLQTPPSATTEEPQARDPSSSTQKSLSTSIPTTRPSANPQNPPPCRKFSPKSTTRKSVRWSESSSISSQYLNLTNPEAKEHMSSSISSKSNSDFNFHARNGQQTPQANILERRWNSFKNGGTRRFHSQA
ncbi:hypothetical protein TNCV_4290961 [Trichonephila clavipes]|nr:hypothetical protein TNCV_4290961 [Trichonephila clavipes]